MASTLHKTDSLKTERLLQV